MWTDQRIDEEIERCLNGTKDASTHGGDIMWLMGWADWSIERMLIMEQQEMAGRTVSTGREPQFQTIPAVDILRSMIQRLTQMDQIASEKAAKLFLKLKNKCQPAQLEELAGLLKILAHWKDRTYWNYEPCLVRRCIVKVGHSEKPTWWCAHLEGLEREAIEITTPAGQQFIIDNENDRGYRKCLAGGGPDSGHASYPDDSTVVRYV